MFYHTHASSHAAHMYTHTYVHILYVIRIVCTREAVCLRSLTLSALWCAHGRMSLGKSERMQSITTTTTTTATPSCHTSSSSSSHSTPKQPYTSVIKTKTRAGGNTGLTGTKALEQTSRRNSAIYNSVGWRGGEEDMLSRYGQ